MGQDGILASSGAAEEASETVPPKQAQATTLRVVMPPEVDTAEIIDAAAIAAVGSKDPNCITWRPPTATDPTAHVAIVHRGCVESLQAFLHLILAQSELVSSTDAMDTTEAEAAIT